MAPLVIKGSDRREQVLACLERRGELGATWRETSAITGLHHGSASSVLSTLHKAGRIACLRDKRDRCHVYVLPKHIGDRATKPSGRRPGIAAALHEADAWRNGYEAGSDDAWQIGYDAAFEQIAAQPSLLSNSVYTDGLEQGRIDQATALLRLTAAMRVAIKGQHRVYAHSRTCWLDHPDCALQAVERALYRTVPPRLSSPEPESAAAS